MDYNKEYKRWCDKAVDMADELKAMDSTQVEDAFYRNLAFGTGGLRGVLGAGTNRMNIYTVAKATQGVADYINKHYSNPSVAISYDSRINSDVFARVAGEVLAANGIQVFAYPELMPTPCLSFAVRYYRCCVGVMITASHNPGKYNGYKVYNEAGCQITTGAASEILEEIEKLDIFQDVRHGDFETFVNAGRIRFIGDDCYTAFIEEVKKQSVLNEADYVDKNVSIIYSPLNGTGLKPVTRILQESGYNQIVLVKEQEMPDGNFPTCPYPNPEVEAAMELGIKYAREHQAELLLATDPDCDRVGIAVRNGSDYQLLTGNEVGMLLLDYICSQRIKNGTMPVNPVMVKTIVTIDMAERIAKHYGVQTVNVLTGFKFIGEQIGFLEKKSEESRYIFGFEESYGYLSGSYVRDKDAVNGAFLICEMFAYYKSQEISLLDKLNELYETYGYCVNTLRSFEFAGSAGFSKMQTIMNNMRNGMETIGGMKVERIFDYSQGIDGLPKSDVLKFVLEQNCSVVVRPSGTEPKLKLYFSISAANKEQAIITENEMAAQLMELLQ